MQQMASRPFASVNVALETDEEPPDLIGGSIKVRMWFRSPENLSKLMLLSLGNHNEQEPYSVASWVFLSFLTMRQHTDVRYSFAFIFQFFIHVVKYSHVQGILKYKWFVSYSWKYSVAKYCKTCIGKKVKLNHCFLLVEEIFLKGQKSLIHCSFHGI